MASDLAWHYTSGSGLIGIFERKVLWATQIQYLNDRNEYLFVYQLAAGIPGRYEGARFDWFRTSPALTDAIENRLLTLATHHDRGRFPAIFVTSFSTKSDSLSQWRAYGGGPGDTYAVGFDVESLTAMARARDWRYEQCIYGSSAVERRVLDILRNTYRRYELGEWGGVPTPEDAALKVLVEELIDVAVIVKDSGFEEESEYRLVSPRIDSRSAELRFRPGSTTLRPFVEFDLASNGFAFRDPVYGVAVGPGPSQPLASAAAMALQVKNFENGGGTCQESTIPYRAI